MMFPNGPSIPLSASFSDVVIGNECNNYKVVLKIYGSIYLCGDILVSDCLNAKCFQTVPGGAKLENTTLSGLSLPIHNSDAANKEYVDSVAQGLSIKQPVKATSNNDEVLFGIIVIDGYQTHLGDRILIKSQTNGVENGIYEVSNGSWSRTTDLALGDSAARTAVFVENGTMNSGSTFVCVNSSPNDIVGVDFLFFELFSQNVQAGLGLYKNGNYMNVGVDNSTIQINGSNLLEIKNGGVTNSKLQHNSIYITAGDGLQNGGSVPLGGSVLLNVDNTVIRTFGGQTILGDLTLTGTLLANTITDGVITINNGSISGINNLTLSGTLEANLITDGVATLSNGILDSLISLNSSTITDGFLLINSGNISNVNNLTLSGILTNGSVTISGNNITGLGPPLLNSDAANKEYVDSLNNNDKWKQPVRVGTTGNIVLSGIQTIDTILLNTGNRVLVKNQTIASQNGIYVVSAGLWSRSFDLPNGYFSSGSIVWIEEGTQSKTGWAITNVQNFDIIGINSINWEQWTGAASIIAGSGLTKTLNTLSVNVDNSTIEIVLNSLQVKPFGITNAQIANLTIANNKLQNSSVEIIAGDGLQNGGVVSLGSSTTLNVDNTVVRTSGNQNIAGVKTFTNSIQLQNNTFNTITFQAPAVLSDYTLTFPVNSGSLGEVLTTDGSGNLSWTNSGSSGSFYYGYDSLGNTSITNTFQTLVINNNVITNANYSNVLGIITITEAGVYEISYYVQFVSLNQLGGTRASISANLQLNGVEIPGSRSSCSLREQSSGLVTPGCGKTIFVNVNSSDNIRISFARTLGTTTGTTKQNESSLTIKKLG